MKNPKDSDDKERELLDFAREYLSEAFPNPERSGCPGEEALRHMAAEPRTADPAISEHLAGCSPCFREYMGLLSQLRKRPPRFVPGWFAAPLRSRTGQVGLVAAAIVIAVAVYFVIARAKHKTPQEFQAVVIDLTEASPERGEEAAPEGASRIPATRVSLTLVLPLGSEEGQYRLSLIRNGAIVWSESTVAQMVNQRITLTLTADFSSVQAGSYSLDVAGPASHLAAPVLVGNNAPSSTPRAP